MFGDAGEDMIMFVAHSIIPLWNITVELSTPCNGDILGNNV